MIDAMASCGAYIGTQLNHHSIRQQKLTCAILFFHLPERRLSELFLVDSARPCSTKIKHFIRPAAGHTSNQVLSGASNHKAPDSRRLKSATLRRHRISTTQALKAEMQGANHTESATSRVQMRATVSGDGIMPLTTASSPISAAQDNAGVEKVVVKGVSEIVVGVLGGGQLGRMLCQAASPLDIKVAILDPQEDAPAASIAFRHVVGSFKDKDSVREFAKGCGVLTVEIEHVDAVALAELEKEGVRVEPHAATLAVIQDKYAQKLHFQSQGVPVADFLEIRSVEDLKTAGARFGFPIMIKSKRDAYDGRGNAFAKTEEGVEGAVESLGGLARGLYVEKWAPFVKELAVMVVRGRGGEIRSYPLVETTHRDNICHTVIVPAVLPPSVSVTAVGIAEKAVRSLGGAGVFGVELFLMPGGEVLLNEVAPRPHNSGHYTIECCFCSQYEQHLRAVVGVALGDTGMKVGAGGMINILGEGEGEEGFRIASEMMTRALGVGGASVHWYGKPEIRVARKVGHITVVGATAAEVSSKMAQISGVGMGKRNGKPEAGGQTDPAPISPSPPLVSIIMGSDSDLGVMKSAAQILDSFSVPYELTVVSAHRTPERMVDFATSAHHRGVQVIIAGAGGAAHLPGMVAALTPLPVIGVPVKATHLDGVDSLLSILQMPRGVPVATVAINNATNAGLLAVRILGCRKSELLEKMETYQQEMEDQVLEKAQRLESVGWETYLASM